MLNYDAFVCLYKKCKENKAAEITNVNITHEGRIFSFDISGFSKSETITVGWNIINGQGCITTYERYGMFSNIDDYDDLVRLAWSWYIDSKFRGLSIPSEWVEDFVRLGLVKSKQIYVES